MAAQGGVAVGESRSPHGETLLVLGAIDALEVPVADGAASLQEAIADVLTRKAVAACTAHGVGTLVVVGGVAANSRVRALARRGGPAQH